MSGRQSVEHLAIYAAQLVILLNSLRHAFCAPRCHSEFEALHYQSVSKIQKPATFRCGALLRQFCFIYTLNEWSATFLM